MTPRTFRLRVPVLMALIAAGYLNECALSDDDLELARMSDRRLDRLARQAARVSR